jgi:hypothetical protein
MKNPGTQTQLQAITEDTLEQENIQYNGTNGISANNRGQGFIPAFLDTETGNVYPSRFGDGRPAPVHMLSGLPHYLFDPDSSSTGHPTVKRSVISGFLREQTFYSRAAALQAMVTKCMH